jgi:tetratricopeptide (TPR) repeat protein
VEDLTEAALVASANRELDTSLALYNAALDAQAKLVEAAENGRSIELTDQRINLLDKRAEVKTQLGDPDGAREDYRTALQLHTSTETLQSSPSWYEKSASLHLNIGQTSTGTDAVASYTKAMSILEFCLTECQKVGEKAAVLEITQQLSSVCCSTAEVYLTDLCEEPDAEEQCEKWVQKALTYQTPAPDSTEATQPTVDALQLLANLRISQCRASEALPVILEAYQQLQGPCQSLASLVDITPNQQDEGAISTDGAMELTQVDAVQALPGFEFRCQMAKIMLEAAASSENVDAQQVLAGRHAAIYVLGSLMAENDEVIEIYSLLGDAFNAISSYEEALSYWQSALEMLSQIKQAMEEDMQLSPDMEDDDADAADEREDEIQKQLDEVMCQIDDLECKTCELKEKTGTEVVPMQE